ncbi:MAG: hypothetical protein BroJett014_13000 [Planctomycetota bacterium]|nr:hypothetical protein [Planctomycetota bacterium]GIK52327.1 MAG: hypothetical protein BroJett014_13000 [Planctomycetota bacterium]
MIDKQMVLDSMLKEIHAIKHLASKVPAGFENYRPGEKQRSMIELLRYLTYCGISGLKAGLSGNWEIGKSLAESAAKLGLTEIPAALERQASELKGLFASIAPDDFSRKMVQRPGQEALPLGRFILDSGFKYLPSYKMQLFLYLKQSGQQSLNSSNLWRGEDPKPN